MVVKRIEVENVYPKNVSLKWYGGQAASVDAHQDTPKSFLLGLDSFGKTFRIRGHSVVGFEEMEVRWSPLRLVWSVKGPVVMRIVMKGRLASADHLDWDYETDMARPNRKTDQRYLE